jgi:hypothetical protein
VTGGDVGVVDGGALVGGSTGVVGGGKPKNGGGFVVDVLDRPGEPEPGRLYVLRPFSLTYLPGGHRRWSGGMKRSIGSPISICDMNFCQMIAGYVPP